MNFTDWLAEQAATRRDEVAEFAQGPACHGGWPVDGQKLEVFEDFVVQEFGPIAVKTLHVAWNEFQASKAPKPAQSPFGGSMLRSVSRASAPKTPPKTPSKPRSRAKPKDDPEPVSLGYQHPNFWEGHPALDKTALPLKPPGR